MLFAIKSSKGGTSPGVDGLPIEFYKIFSSLISPRLVDVFNSMLGDGQLGRDQNCAVIFLSCKGGGPRVVVSTAAFHARVRGSVPGLGGLKETKIVSSPSTCES